MALHCFLGLSFWFRKELNVSLACLIPKYQFNSNLCLPSGRLGVSLPHPVLFYQNGIEKRDLCTEVACSGAESLRAVCLAPRARDNLARATWKIISPNSTKRHLVVK